MERKPQEHFLSRRAALGLIGAAVLTPRGLWARGLERRAGTAFGTYWSLTSAPHPALGEVTRQLPPLFARIDQLMSPWRPDSDISVFNAAGPGVSLRDGALYDLARAAVDLAGRSDGMFDPTVGPAVARWGFGPIHHGAPGGWDTLIGPDRTLTKPRADLTLDLCGIAKGWALDQAAALARRHGIDDALLDLGGEFVALGAHPDGRPWRLAVEAPGGEGPSPATLSLPDGAAVATSGTGIQSFWLEGRLVSHIVDPATAAPTKAGVSSVTVVAGDAMTADGWATALCVAGPERGPEMAADNGVTALFLIEDKGEVVMRRSGGIATFIL